MLLFGLFSERGSHCSSTTWNSPCRANSPNPCGNPAVLFSQVLGLQGVSPYPEKNLLSFFKKKLYKSISSRYRTHLLKDYLFSTYLPFSAHYKSVVWSLLSVSLLHCLTVSAQTLTELGMVHVTGPRTLEEAAGGLTEEGKPSPADLRSSLGYSQTPSQTDPKTETAEGSGTTACRGPRDGSKHPCPNVHTTAFDSNSRGIRHLWYPWTSAFTYSYLHRSLKRNPKHTHTPCIHILIPTRVIEKK